MKALINWIGERTGLVAGWRLLADAPIPGGASWLRVWPTTLLFALVVQGITGFFLWCYYSPSAQTAWESVYYLETQVAGGWLLRAIHHYMAQLVIVLAGIYVLQMIIVRSYRAPRELIFWIAVLIGLLSLGSALTGDLLAWDQNSYASTQVRVNFLKLLPVVGGDLFKIAAGGPTFGHLTLTRFMAMHVSLFAAGMIGLWLLHYLLARRIDAAEAKQAGASVPCWPNQAVRNAVACLVVLVVVIVLSFSHGTSPPTAGVALGSPADPDPANFYAGARPEWAFLGLYAFSNLFPGELKLVPIFIIPGIVVLLVLAMPFIDRGKGGYLFNLGLTAVLLVGLVVLSIATISKDAHNEEHQRVVTDEEVKAARVVELAQRPTGIPVEGALSLLVNDPKTQGPAICEAVCASCHNYSAPVPEGEKPEDTGLTTDDPSAPELYGFASREWVAGLLNPEQVGTPRYFGNTRFATGTMVRFVQTGFTKVDEEDQKAIIAALSAEAQLPSQAEIDKKDAALIAKGRELLASETCTRCHRYGEAGTLGTAPDLTGYGSREWLLGAIADVSHPWLYGVRNDRMPVYHGEPLEPANNQLTSAQVNVMARWLRGDWYEPSAEPKTEESPPEPQIPADVLVHLWDMRVLAGPEIAEGPHLEARTLFHQEQCIICHDHTGGETGDLMAADPSAPDLGEFASREWIAGILDPEQVRTRKYFGNSAFRSGKMVGFVLDTFSDLDDLEKEDVDMIVKALSAEAKLPYQEEMDEADADDIETGKELMADYGCVDCHKIDGDGATVGPDLTGYGSREWLTAIISDPQAKSFYPKTNDGMPSYHGDPENPARNLLTTKQVEQIVDWLRGESE